MTALVDVPVGRINPHRLNVRKDLGGLDELAASIKAQGLLQPLIVAPDHGTAEKGSRDYILIAGHRRHAAAVKAKVQSLPCIVRDDLDTDAKVIEAMLVENLQRTDLTVMEEADAYAQLELLGVKEVAIAKATGRARGTVRQRLLLAGLPAERREQYEKGELSLDGAVLCAKLRQQHADDAEIMAMIDKAGTWMFRHDSYGSVAKKIEYLLAERERAANPDPEPEEDDEGTIDYDGARAERQEQWAKQRAAADAERQRLADVWRSHNEWIGGLVVRARSDFDTVLTIAAATFADRIDEDLAEGVLPVVAIETGEDGLPVDWTASDALLYLLLADMPSEFEPTPWGSPGWDLRRRIRWLQAMGYSATADDKVVLAEGAAE